MLNTFQQTIEKEISISGKGLHTGAEVTLTFCPAEENYGIKFQRIDLEDSPIINANVDNVVDISRGTTIANGDARVNTVEHTMAAIMGLQIDNLLIKLNGPEVPIMDGSSEPFVKVLLESQLKKQDADRLILELPEHVNYIDEENGIEISAYPCDNFRANVTVNYNSNVLGDQHADLKDIKDFQKEIAPCRTFVFLHELEMLYNQKLIQGGDFDNAVIVVDKEINEVETKHLAKIFNKPTVKVEKGYLNNVELRFQNEPARHKLLDVVGDLGLIGHPINAHIIADKPGHASNVAFAKKIKKLIADTKKKTEVPKYDPSQAPVMDIKKIYRALPHTFPFLLVDKVIHFEESKIVGVKNVTVNEPFFQGHFPGNPVMPGVLQIEAMAQTGGLLVLNTVPDPENYNTYFLSIESCRFRKMVVPGDTLLFKCELLAPIKRGIIKIQGKAYVADSLVCEAVLTASIVRKEEEK